MIVVMMFLLISAIVCVTYLKKKMNIHKMQLWFGGKPRVARQRKNQAPSRVSRHQQQSVSTVRDQGHWGMWLFHHWVSAVSLTFALGSKKIWKDIRDCTDYSCRSLSKAQRRLRTCQISISAWIQDNGLLRKPLKMQNVKEKNAQRSDRSKGWLSISHADEQGWIS